MAELLGNLRIKHQLIRPYTPRHNGKVERSHRTDGENFYRTLTFETYDELKEKMQEYQVCFVKFVQRQKKRTGLLPSSSCKDSDPYLMLPAKFTVMVVAGMAEMSLETVTSPSYMAFTRAL